MLALAVMPATASAQTWVTVDLRTVSAPPDELAALRAEYQSALNAADAGRLTALYAADAIAAPAEGVLLRGRDQIDRYLSETCQTRAADTTVTLTPQRFSVEGRVASETGVFTETTDGNPAAAATGVYVTIYERAPSGEWRIAMEIRTRGRDRQIVRW